MLGGPLLYEFFSANLHLSDIRTVRRFISDSADLIIEGQCRAKELKTFLETNKYPSYVWVSEDATRISNKVQFDPSSNTLIGLVAPWNEHSMPRPHFFKVDSAAKIKEFFDNYDAANMLYTYMAQPLVKDSIAFCLCIIAMRNVFVAQDAIKRQRYITEC